MKAVRASYLGQFAVTVDGQPVEIPYRASQSLFAYLVLTRETPHRRELLAGMFWPDSSEANARNNLRHALWQIRSALGEDMFLSDKLAVSLNPEIDIVVDADRLDPDATASLEAMSAAADIYQGDLLPGFYDDWVILERERLRGAYARLMERLLEGLIAARRWGEVSEWGERWIAMGHVPEPAFRALMVAHAARGNQVGVEAVYQQCVDTLERELGVEPSPQTLLLHEQLLKGDLPTAAAPTKERYELGGEIGRGGMGEVYRARDTWLEREVAVKVLSSEILGPEGRERLLAEAQAAARLNHPNVVSVHDVGEIEGQPFIVMELVEGETLHDHPPESQAETLSIVLEICAALEHAHAQGIIHRDLKPENVMLAPDGMARLMDFGLASRTVEAPQAPEGSTAGTVYYLAPEVLQGEHASVQSDLYALGVLLYELLTEELPFQGEDPIAVISQHLEAEPRPPSELNTEIRPALEALILRLLSKRPEERPLSAAAVAEVLEAVAPEEMQLGEPAPGEPPFKGLAYYDVEDAEIFFGREALVERLMDRLRDERFLAVIVGASGSGKSSIARAGLVPALSDGKEGEWIFRLMTPTEQPLSALSEALMPYKESEAETAPTPEDLANDPTGLHNAAQWLVDTEGAKRLLLIVDQLEELFTLCRDEAERSAFIDNLLTAADPDTSGPTVVVITLRADFYPHCAAYPSLREALARNQEYIGPMNTAELRRAIEEPALRGGWKFQSGLVDLMLRDVRGEPGALPLLSHALLETWRRRSRRTLTLRGYAEAGGVRRAIARTAENVFHKHLDEQQRDTARNIFLRLTELGEGTEDTRRRVTQTELVPNSGQNGTTEKVLATLVEARLLTLSEKHVEVAHEALIREWPRLREWLDEDREGLRIHRHLTEAAQAWEALERDPGELYRGGRLAQALEWSIEQQPELNPLEHEFLEASQTLAEQREAEREAQLKRLRRRAIYMGGALLIAMGLGLAAAFFGNQASLSADEADRSLKDAELANTQVVAEVNIRATAEAIAIQERSAAKDQAEIATSRELAAAALENLDEDPERSALLAIEALKMRHTFEAENALHQAVNALRLEDVIGQAGVTTEQWTVEYSPDGMLLATGGTDGQITLWDTGTGANLVTWPGHSDWVEQVRFHPDGTILATASQDTAIRIWDVSASIEREGGVELNELFGHEGVVQDLAFSPDGVHLVSVGDDGAAVVWNVSSGELVTRWQAKTDRLFAVAFDPTGDLVATGGVGSGVTLWDPSTGEQLRTLSTQSRDVWSLRFSPDGRLLASGGVEFLEVWRIDKSNADAIGDRLFSVFAHLSDIDGLSFNGDGSLLSTGSQDGIIKVWDPESGEELFRLAGEAGAVDGISISPECLQPPDYPFEWCGRNLASTHSNGTIRIWDLSPARSRELATLPGFSASFDDSGKLAFTTRFIRGDFTSRQQVVGSIPQILGEVWDLSRFTPSVSSGGSLSPIESRQTIDYDQPIMTGDDLGNIGVGIFADYMAIVTGSVSGAEINRFSMASHQDRIRLPILSNDGTLLATPSHDGTAKIWDLASGQELLSLDHGVTVLHGEFSPDDTRFATGDVTGAFTVWDVVSGQQLMKITAHPTFVTTVAFSPDGQTIATGSRDTTVKFWDSTTGEELATFRGHSATVQDLAFDPSGSLLATVSTDSTLNVWDLPTGQLRASLVLPGWAWKVEFNADGTRLMTASQADFAVRLFAVEVAELIEIARARVTRDLTHEECQTYLHLDACPSRG